MNQDQKEFVKLIEKSNKILIFPAPQSVDALASAFALYFFLRKVQKDVSIFQKKIPEKISFLKKPKKIINDLAGSRDFVVIFNTEKNPILRVNTEKKEKEFRINVTPEKGSIDPRDFSFVPAEFKYDLIITIGAADLEKFREVYFNNTDLFFEVPKINIDYHSDNENYGQINLVGVTASSCAEIIAEILLKEFEPILNEKISMALLTGIVSATESFQCPTTTPQAMITAAKLMKYGANQSTIIRHLYKTKSLAFLKLWGRVMARLNSNENKKLVWSLISAEDFVQSRANEKDIPFILEEIEKNFLEGQIFAIFYPDKNLNTLAKIKFSDEKTAQKVCTNYKIETSKNISLTFNHLSLLEAENDFLKKINGN